MKPASQLYPRAYATHMEYRGGSLRSRLLALSMRATVKPFLGLWGRFPHLPWPTGIVDHAGRILPVAPGTTFKDARLPRCGAEWILPAKTNERVIVYLHGGAFMVGGQYLHRHMVSRFARETCARVLNVHYRMMPKHSIADAIEDALDAYEHVLAHGTSPEQVVFAGDSAGGFLSLMAPIAAHRAGLPKPGAVIAMSPLTDLDPTRKLEAPTSKTCSVFPRSAVPSLTKVAEHVHRRRARGSGPLESPIDCDVRGMPPTLIQMSSSEMIYPDAVAMAQRLADAHVPCEMHVWGGQVHVFQASAAITPEGAQAMVAAADFLERVVPAWGASEAEDVADVA